MLDTDQLRSFIAIVDTGSFTRAAERVNKTQSAVSMHMKRLEERLGKALFNKQGRNARLTNDGERLIDHARTILRAEAAAVEAITRKGIAGEINFGIPDDYAGPLLADIIAYFSLHYPLVEMKVFCQTSSELADLVRTGALDLAVMTAGDERVDAEVIKEEPLCWVAGQHRSVEEERPLPLAIGHKNCRWANSAKEALELSGIPFKYTLVSYNYAAIDPIVDAGLAITILPESLVRKTQRIVSQGTTLPPLPNCKIGLMKSAHSRIAEIDALYDCVRATILEKGSK